MDGVSMLGGESWEPVTVGLLEQAETWLREARAGQAIVTTYRRGASSSTVPAVQARTRWQTDGGEIFLDSTHADFLIERANLVISGAEVLPQPGDRIKLELDHGDEWFEVATLGNEPCYKWHGRDGGTYRVHTVRIAPPDNLEVYTADNGTLTADDGTVTADAA